jgi:hypothetical protein
MESYILAIVFLLIINIIGWALVIFKDKASDGELIIDTSNPDKDIYRLELGNELEKLRRKKTITLKVIHKSSSQ